MRWHMPEPFSFHLTHPDGRRETFPVGRRRCPDRLYRRDRPPRLALVIGTYGSVPYVHLGLETRRRHYPGVPVLVHDDCSPQRDELAEVCREYGASFQVNSAKRFHTVGDLSVFLGGLSWARRLGADLLVKFSRRFVPLFDWTPALLELALESQEATFSNVCRNLMWGFRSEVVGMHVRSWAATCAERIRWDLLTLDETFVEGTIHGLARAIEPCRAAERYRAAHPREAWCDGYCPWPLLGENRIVRVPDVLWHHACAPAEYYAVARAWGLPYAERDFEVVESWIREQ